MIKRQGVVQPPARLDAGIEGPTAVTVVKRAEIVESHAGGVMKGTQIALSGSRRAQAAVAVVTGDDEKAKVQLIDIEPGDARSGSNRSRRFKPKPKKKK